MCQYRPESGERRADHVSLHLIEGGRPRGEDDPIGIGDSGLSVLGREDSNLQSPDPESDDRPGASDNSGPSRSLENNNTGAGRQTATDPESEHLSPDDRLAVALARRGRLSLGCFIDNALQAARFDVRGYHPESDTGFVRVIERYADALEART